MTKFAFEVPIDHLEDFADLQDYLFALSFLMTDQRYVEHLRMVRGSKLLILDNSWNELQKSSTVDELSKLNNIVKADYIVSPDGSSAEEVVNNFKSMKLGGFTERQLIIPIRSSKDFESVKGYATQIAVPYRWRPFLPETFPWTKTHFLGLRDPLEIKMCRPLSCDTAIPIKLALVNLTIDNWITMSCPHEHTTPAYFYKTMPLKQIQLARQNIVRLKELCNE